MKKLHSVSGGRKSEREEGAVANRAAKRQAHSREVSIVVCIFEVVLAFIILASKDITQEKKEVWINHRYFLLYTQHVFPLNFITSSIHFPSIAFASTPSC